MWTTLGNKTWLTNLQGWVGIKTNDPQCPLDVNGTIRGKTIIVNGAEGNYYLSFGIAPGNTVGSINVNDGTMNIYSEERIKFAQVMNLPLVDDLPQYPENGDILRKVGGDAKEHIHIYLNDTWTQLL